MEVPAIGAQIEARLKQKVIKGLTSPLLSVMSPGKTVFPQCSWLPPSAKTLWNNVQ